MLATVSIVAPDRSFVKQPRLDVSHRRSPRTDAFASVIRAPLLFVLASAALVACEGEKASAETKPKSAEPPPAKVETVTVRKGSIRDGWRFLGEVRSAARASLASGANGAVTRVLAREGDRIAKGKLLVEVDPALVAARLDVADSSERRGVEALAQAKRELERLDALEKNIVAAVELERARSQVQELEASLAGLAATAKEARAQLALHRVRAPFDGVVARRTVDPGDWVRPGDPVLELVSTGDVEVLVDAARELFMKVAVGDVVKILAEPTIEGEVVGIVPALSPVSRTMRVRVVPKTDPERLLPGGAVEVEFAVDLSGDGLVVPQDALLVGATNTRIIRVVDGKATPTDVKVLAKADGDALVRADELKDGDEVVVRGNERLRPGQAVQR